MQEIDIAREIERERGHVLSVFLAGKKLVPRRTKVLNGYDIVVINMHDRKDNTPVTPPRELPGVILNIKEAYRSWIPLHRDFPKVERLGLGQRIDASFLNTLSTAYRAVYLPPQEKIVMLSQTISHIDMVRFFMQMAWENKLIHTERYSELVSRLEEIGRQLGGWKKGLQSKTPAKKTGEKQ